MHFSVPATAENIEEGYRIHFCTQGRTVDYDIESIRAV